MRLFNTKIAGLLVLAISFFYSAKTQTSSAGSITKTFNADCEGEKNPNLEIGISYNFQFSELDSAKFNNVKKVKIKSKEIELTQDEKSDLSFSGTALKTGTATIKSKVILNDGTKIIQNQAFTVLELPELIVAITVTSPDSKFMWLNLIDKNTGQSANSSFNLCSIKFTLLDSSGSLKEQGESNKDDEYFPSVTLRQLPVKFQLNDRLTLQIIVNHYESNLPVHINQELTISKLWN